jgi:hypothetical protein
MENGRFLTLPHPEVQEHAERRARDHDRWIRGMSDLRKRAVEAFGDPWPEHFYKLL